MAGGTDPKAQVLKARGREEKKSSWLGKTFLVLVVLAGLGGAGYWYLYVSPDSMLRLTEKVLSTVDAASGNSVNLYFADVQWTKLVPEKVSMANEPDKGKKITRLVELLARGPSGEAGAVLPRSARVRQVYLGAGGLVIVDLDPGLDELKGQGPGAEMLSVFAIVHTVTENVEGVRSVRLLVGGKEVETLAGNVSINEPLRPRMELLGKPK